MAVKYGKYGWAAWVFGVLRVFAGVRLVFFKKSCCRKNFVIERKKTDVKIIRSDYGDPDAVAEK